MLLRCMLVVLSLAGCRTGLLEPPDLLGSTDLTGARLDLAVAPRDFAVPPGTCATHRLEFVKLDEIALVDAEPRLMAALRVAASYTASPACDLPGPIEVTVMQGNATDGVRIIARVWRRSPRGRECDAIARVTRIITVSDTPGLSSPAVVVADGAPGGTTVLNLKMLPPAGASCNPVPLSGPCVNDCECKMLNPIARCVPTGGPTRGVCIWPCSEDADCANEMFPRCGGQGPAKFACGGGACGGDAECPFGQRCQSIAALSKACRPTETSNIRTCTCGSDCSPWEVCGEGVCSIPCVTARDCTGGDFCNRGRCNLIGE